MNSSQQTNSMAVVSLVAALVDWVVGGFFGCLAGFILPFCGCITFPIFALGNIVAVVTGHLAQNQINNSGGAQSGNGLAIAGVILGWIGIGLMILTILVIVVIAILTIFGIAIGNVFPNFAP